MNKRGKKINKPSLCLYFEILCHAFLVKGGKI
ncbi:hypothetical protein C623_0220740 [Bacillus thuringiensis serovar aizawai str. Hu4-2]|nr:hypothetical protein C623_0220740 [Bacillus thuringiensis serovar aizawai str. Hu4-2]